MFEVAPIEKVLGVKFKDKPILQTAFVHRSYLNEHRKSTHEHNERLEFLGDAVLELVVTDYLYRHYPNPEGELTSWRSAMVKTESLADVAEKLEIGQYLQMSRGELKTGGRQRQALLANLVEALIGALYLDQDYATAEKFITKHIIAKLNDILAEGAHIDAKSHFQEIAQEKSGITPHYAVLEESGPDHDKTFVVGVYLDKKLMGKGTGNSKQNAQQAAASAALKAIKK